MAQEFTIKSPDIETKINQLLPSQGGFAPGVDFSASTMVIPIVDLTETAEGSGLRQDLQNSISLINANTFNVQNTVTTLITTTGYWRILAVSSQLATSASIRSNYVQITDGITTKNIWQHSVIDSNTTQISDIQCDFIVYLRAGDSLNIGSTSARSNFIGTARQIADIDGNLVNP